NVTLILMGICYFLLALVLALPRIEHVHRWINLGFTTFQPSEIAKFAAILWCATYISDHYKEINITSYPDLETKARVNRSKVRKWFYSMGQSFMTGVLPFLIWLGPMLVLIVIEPHLSCTVLMVLIIGTMMFVGGTNKGFFTILIALAVLAGYLVIYTDIVPYGSKRIKVWQDPFYDKLGDGWQNIQSLYAISSGGLFGVGIGNSKQKYLYIAEPQNDFVFAVICEEVGLIGAMLVVAMFVFFVWRGFSVSLANPNRFCKLVGIGITAQIGFQMLLNICVVTNMVPNTGISLPFFSYGGTSLMMLLLEIGVLLAISRTSPNKII
ncbi:MAG: FtsW/RodA/SpoVE family cell cycle protein, partial [Clostridia bacterium]|nr:FtsW/RodA/SpoVE family cell cycle protein [Clostridia bacterium]